MVIKTSSSSSSSSSTKNKANPPPAKTPNRQPSSSRHKSQKPSPAHDDADSADAAQSPKQQQVVLNIFSDAFASVLSSDRFPVLLREIKQALYRREFGAAFGREEYLEAYAARWSPTRALCYASVFLGIHHYVDGISTTGIGGHAGAGEPANGTSTTTGTGSETSSEQPLESDQVGARDGESGPSKWQSSVRMLCIGGCAAEHVAFASYIQTTNRHGILTLLDAAPWAHVASRLQSAVTMAPPLSRYASASAIASNRALLETNQLDFAFTQADVLDLAESKLADLAGPQPQIVTLLFTLNELYTEVGIGKTTTFLRALGRVLPAESLLLVVDSPGSYSEAAVGKEKEKKKYPMQWLLHHTLQQSEETSSPAYTWERLESHDSIWFRLPEGLAYPIRLESMRYQMHLYRLHKKPT
ncbi:hypothetical protein E4U41_004046 [Claviceps citrina]|nr:hypothetical protein E4U41_004046 [Claviceps citrina]